MELPLRVLRTENDARPAGPDAPACGGEGAGAAADGLPVVKRKRRLPPEWKQAQASTALPALVYQGRCFCIRERGAAEAAALQLIRMRLSCVGLDIEWKVTYIPGQPPRQVATLQLCFSPASSRGRRPGTPPLSTPCVCLIFQLFATGVPESLHAFLADHTVQKLGCGIMNDANKLQNDYGVTLGGIQELSDVANARLEPGEERRWSLRDLVARFLHLNIDKNPRVRCSDWEHANLTCHQVVYAATDAWAALLCYWVLLDMPVISTPEPAYQAGPAIAPAVAVAMEARAQSPVMVPRCVEGVLTVQPTKRACWQLHMSEHSMPDIARLRGIRLETVLSYLAECVRAGMGYRWDLMGVSDEDLAVVRTAVVEALRGTASSCPDSQAMSSRLHVEALMERLGQRGVRLIDIAVRAGGRISVGQVALAVYHLGRTDSEVQLALAPDSSSSWTA